MYYREVSVLQANNLLGGESLGDMTLWAIENTDGDSNPDDVPKFFFGRIVN